MISTENDNLNYGAESMEIEAIELCIKKAQEEEASKNTLDRHANINQCEEEEDSKSGLDDEDEVGESNNDSLHLKEEEGLLFETMDKEEEEELSHADIDKGNEEIKHSKLHSAVDDFVFF